MTNNEITKTYCTKCPYFNDVIEFSIDGREPSWYGARCGIDGHTTTPSMYAIKMLHNNCPLIAESEVKE